MWATRQRRKGGGGSSPSRFLSRLNYEKGHGQGRRQDDAGSNNRAQPLASTVYTVT